jgi:hypothetical protein
MHPSNSELKLAVGTIFSIDSPHAACVPGADVLVQGTLSNGESSIL